MSVFFEILKSINNPNQQGSVDQLSTIVETVQQLGAGNAMNPQVMQTVLSSVGGQLLPALQQQGGGQVLTNILGQVTSGKGLNGLDLTSLLTPELQQQIVQGVAAKTGLDATMLQSVLPQLLPAIMGLLNMGASKSGTGGVNSVLTAFLDGNGDGAMDLGDVFKFAGRFLNPA